MALPNTFAPNTKILSAAVNANFVYLDNATIALTTVVGGKLTAANNLSDLTNAVTARANLGLGSAAVAATGTSGHTLGFLDGNNAWSNTNTFTTQSPGDNSTKAATTAYVAVAVAASTNTPRDYIAGLILSAAGGTGIFGVAIGAATSSNNLATLALSVAFTKTTAAWTVGSANGALDTGSIANGWYHVFIIERPDTAVIDIAISLSATAPTTGGAIPAAYTLFRRIGSILNAAGAWTAFTQIGNDFFWTTAVSGATGTLAVATPSLVTLTGVPTGVKVKVCAAANQTVASGGATYIALSSPDTGGQAATITNGIAACNGSSATANGVADVWCNTSAQIYVAVTGSVSTTYSVGVLGWTDQRGQNN